VLEALAEIEEAIPDRRLWRSTRSSPRRRRRGRGSHGRGVRLFETEEVIAEEIEAAAEEVPLIDETEQARLCPRKRTLRSSCSIAQPRDLSRRSCSRSTSLPTDRRVKESATRSRRRPPRSRSK